ncbi:MAG TPA: hypothetical protein VK939_05540 [Longimicrobiales bacterium]|nr:hypothetical protein [Longimicrobiales bacterium]
MTSAGDADALPTEPPQVRTAGAPPVTPGAPDTHVVPAWFGEERTPSGVWRAAILLVAFAAVAGALPPLHEMDLAQHLATGEWIVRRGAVPFTEPFAWTRAGEPYFAYSWLAQVIYYVLLRAFGPVALHVLEGLIVGSATAAALWAARQFGWRPAARLAVGVLHLALLWGVAGTLRPQQVLFIAVPLAWGIAARIRTRGARASRLLALAAVGALAANTHIFFALTAVPIAWFAIEDPRRTRWLGAGAALAVGWLLTPYALAWPAVFALNFGDNVLLGRPPSISEFVPGFEYARERLAVIVVVLVLLTVPWLTAARARPLPTRVGAALFWSVGLLLFAYAGRLVFAWWTLALPIAGYALHVVAGRAAPALARGFGRLVAAGLAAILLSASVPPISPAFWLFEGDATNRMLPRAGEDPALWLPTWLLCHTQPGARGRIFTEFNYGSELTWRLPGYSPSIDGRTIFPDSDAVEFSFQPYGRRGGHASTWRHADLALLDRSFWLAPVLDTVPDWVLLAQARATSRGTLAALWAKREWWQRWGTAAQLPALDIRVLDPRARCAAEGVFPRP